jgi:hypothetical protein
MSGNRTRVVTPVDEQRVREIVREELGRCDHEAAVSAMRKVWGETFTRSSLPDNQAPAGDADA